MSRVRSGRIFIISSPSGGGKTTVCSRLKKTRPNIEYSISATTRRPRKGEKDGKDYHFLKKVEFLRRISRNDFLEWENNFGHLYGTPRGPVEKALSKGKDIMLAIDVKGAMQVKKAYPSAILIFLRPPSMILLKKRLSGRKTESPKTQRERLRIAKKELTYLKKYDHIIVNDKLDKAVKTLRSIITTKTHNIKK